MRQRHRALVRYYYELVLWKLGLRDWGPYWPTFISFPDEESCFGKANTTGSEKEK